MHMDLGDAIRHFPPETAFQPADLHAGAAESFRTMGAGEGEQRGFRLRVTQEGDIGGQRPAVRPRTGFSWVSTRAPTSAAASRKRPRACR